MKVVVIGTSYGGLYALMDLLSKLPSDFPAPIIVVQHRAHDDDDTRLARILERHSTLPIADAEDKQRLEPGRVYLAPADYHLMIERDHLSLTVDEPVNFSRPSIDVLFESAAATFGKDVIAILLTGLGRDGATGIARVRAAGGATIVQDPESAERGAMPQAGMDAGAAEVLTLDEIATRLVAA